MIYYDMVVICHNIDSEWHPGHLTCIRISLLMHMAFQFAGQAAWHGILILILNCSEMPVFLVLNHVPWVLVVYPYYLYLYCMQHCNFQDDLGASFMGMGY